MLIPGTFQNLQIDRLTSVGFYLIEPESGEDVLLPNKYITNAMQIGDNIDVFIYLDKEHRPVATTEIPFLTLNEFAFLTVFDVSQAGAFVDWGLEKHLLVPFDNQLEKMEIGNAYMIHLYWDDKSQRLVGTSKLKKFENKTFVDDIEKGDEVDIEVYRFSDLGCNVIVNKKYSGLIYKDELFEKIRIGDKRRAFVKAIWEDNKIDISLNPIGYASIEPNADKILNILIKENGFLGLHDKSDAGLIVEKLQMSKKVFKKAIGLLYKEKKILLKENGIELS